LLEVDSKHKDSRDGWRTIIVHESKRTQLIILRALILR
jgi:hypothetical protein